MYPPKGITYDAGENIIVGNVALYGATSGKAYISGVAGERFCVRNSGAIAVVEGVGDHGCEYMTGGRAVILGHTGKNFAAGMSGGISYVYDVNGTFEAKVNTEMVLLDVLNDKYEKEILTYIEKHFAYTGSIIAKNILHNWTEEKNKFKVVISPEYKKLFDNGEVK